MDPKTEKVEKEPAEGEGKLRAVKLGISKGVEMSQLSMIKEGAQIGPLRLGMNEKPKATKAEKKPTVGEWKLRLAKFGICKDLKRRERSKIGKEFYQETYREPQVRIMNVNTDLNKDLDLKAVKAEKEPKEEPALGGEGAYKATEAAEEAVGERRGRRMAARSRRRKVERSSCFSPTSLVGASMR